MMVEEEVERRKETQPLHLAPNPNCCRTSIKKSHRTLSKAFSMSNFKNKAGCLVLYRALTRF
jgi:hypothetical protein